MFGKKKNEVSYEEKIRDATYKRIRQTLRDISEIEIEASSSKDGKKEIDYAAICKEVKAKARLAIEFVDDLEREESNGKKDR